jgi:hypothetical protein
MKIAVLAAACLAALALPASAQQPPKPTHSSDAELCRWIWWSGALPTGGSIGAWTERCDLPTGLWELDYTATLPGFWLTIDGEARIPVIHVFAKPADAGIDAILPALRGGGHIPDDDECVFAPPSEWTLMTVGPTQKTQALFEIVPVGPRLAAIEATPDDEIPEPQCGDYGSSTHGTRYFVTDTRHPDKAVYLDLGQDGTMFDHTSVTIVE